MCAATASNAATVAAPTAGYSLCSLKSNYQHLIHQLEIVCNGKTVEQMQPFISVAKHFQLLSQMSATDLKSNAQSLGLSEVLDNEKSVQWNTQASANAPGGIGLANNRPFIQSIAPTLTVTAPAAFVANALYNIAGTTPPASTESQLYLNKFQNGGTVNGAIQKRISRVVDTSKANGNANSFNNIFGSNSNAGAYTPCILSSSQLQTELKPYYTVVGNIMCWYDVGLIPLKYISDFIDKLGLVKKLDLVIRAYFNTGSLQIAYNAGTGVPTTANPGYKNYTDAYYGAVSNSTFSNTCPFTVNLIADATANGGINETSTYIAAGLFIAKPPTTAIGAAGVNLALNVPGHPMPACRCYYSQVKLDPSRALTYVQENRQKQVVYESVLFNQYTNISSGNAFSQLVQSGIKNPVAVLIVPFISSQCGVQTGADGKSSGTAIGITQYGNPVDTAPSSFAPISLTNIVVSLGGVNVLNTSMNYTFENFLEQIAIAETLTSADIGISVGVITQQWWETNRVYFFDLARSREADKSMPRNLNISFNNNTLVPIDVMVFTLYLDKVVIDIETGIVSK